jgi:hypothetical protein
MKEKTICKLTEYKHRKELENTRKRKTVYRNIHV